MRIKCHSVRLECLVRISDKAYRATAFDGSTAIIPASMIFGQDYDVMKSEAHWISSWILEQKELQYSAKKTAWFDKDTGRMLPDIKIEKHVPAKLEPVNKEPDANLIR